MKQLLKPRYVFFGTDHFEIKCENGMTRTVSFATFQNEYGGKKGYVVEIDGETKLFSYEQWFDWLQLGFNRDTLKARLEYVINKEEARKEKIAELMTVPKHLRNEWEAEYQKRPNLFGVADTDNVINLNTEEVVSTESAA